MKLCDRIKAILNSPEELERLRNENENLKREVFEIKSNDCERMTEREVREIVNDELNDFEPDLDYDEISDRVNDYLDYPSIAEEVEGNIDGDVVRWDDFNDLKKTVESMESDHIDESKVDSLEKRVSNFVEGLGHTMEFMSRVCDMYRDFHAKYSGISYAK